MKTRILILAICFITSLTSYSQSDEFKRHLVRAETAFKMGKLTEAVTEYKEAIKLDSVNGNLYYNLAAVQEKIGTVEAFNSAIENYKKYLKMIPDASDKDDVMTKIYAIEFKLEDQIKRTKHLENLNGTWRSDMRVTKTGLPLWLFNLNVIGDELRITVSPRSALYKSDFTYQTVTIPFNEKSVAFAFTNDKVVAAQNNNAEHTIVDMLASQSGNASLLSPLLHGVLNATATAGYQSISSYIFKLKIIGDSIAGTMQVIEKRLDNTTNKIIGDEIQQISFNKGSENYAIPEPTAEEKLEQKKASYFLKDDMGMRFGYIKTKPNSDMNALGYDMNGLGFMNGFSWDFVSTVIHFSTKRSPVKLGMYLSDNVSLLLGTKDLVDTEKPRDALVNISFCIGPAFTLFPARKTALSAYYAIKPGVSFDFHQRFIPDEGIRFVFMQGLGFQFRLSKLILNFEMNYGKTKYLDTEEKVNLAYPVFSIGFSF